MKTKDFISEYKYKNQHCVYRLISKDGVVIYVGSSSYPSNRIYSHMGSDKDFCSVEADFFDSADELAKNEAMQIAEYNPKHNTLMPASLEFITLKSAQDIMTSDIKRITRNLPYEFCRGNTNYISASNFNKLRDVISESSTKTLTAIIDLSHKKECK